MTRRLAITLAAAAVLGAALGWSLNRNDGSAGAPMRARTVTVTETVVRAMDAPDTRAGRRVFASTCSRCHALRPGDWTGDKVNLTALQPTYEVTVEKVTRGGIAMPSFAGKLSERQIRDVAAFVSKEAARQGRR
jgi:mono/diheme cytochrome c family protein